MWVLYDNASKQWVGQVDFKYVLVPTVSLAHKFALHAVAAFVLANQFSSVPYQMVIQKV